MKAVILIDSFKGSITSMEAGYGAKEGILRVFPEAEVVVKPLADGGEGTTDALIEGLKGEKITCMVTGPMGKPVEAYYGILADKETAVMEMAQAGGITLVPEDGKDPKRATTYGVGEMILDGAKRGCKKFIMGIGGSATNDGGIGMLKALGVQFFTSNGTDVGEGAEALEKIHRVSIEDINPLLKDAEFRVACDVKNPLCGNFGATYIYGSQKGVLEGDKEAIDLGMAQYAKVTAKLLCKDASNMQGAGAAGGLGFAFSSYLNASLLPGIELILDVIHLEEELKGADIVITGEGRLDAQTAMGKAPIGVAKRAKAHGCKVLAFAGGVTEDARACNKEGIDAFFPIVRGITTLSEAMEKTNAKRNLTDTVEQVFRIL